MNEFKNVPNWLFEKVRALRNNANLSNREEIYLTAAGWTIAQFLHIDISKESSTGFFQNRTIDDSGRLWHGTVNRAILVAGSLFLLRSTPGFEEFCRRMKERDIRASFFELLAAKQFFKQGFQLLSRPEIRIKGKDFDFSAKKDSRTINVEVTAFTASTFSRETISNALYGKRTQLPDTDPAVFYCAIPEDWLATPINWDEELLETTNTFFRRSRRINAIVFWMERHMDKHDGEGGGWALIRKPYRNPNPRISSDEINFLFEPGLNGNDFRTALETGIGLSKLEKESYNSDFFYWVDQLVFH